jgi:hypothetical protein
MSEHKAPVNRKRKQILLRAPDNIDAALDRVSQREERAKANTVLVLVKEALIARGELQSEAA